MKVFKLPGNKSTIKLTLDTLIHLHENKNYMLRLVGFYSDNYISNMNQDIEEEFRFGFGRKGYTCPFFRNQYSIEDLEKIFRESLNLTVNSMTDDEKVKYNSKDFKIETNRNLNLLNISPMGYLVDKKYLCF